MAYGNEINLVSISVRNAAGYEFETHRNRVAVPRKGELFHTMDGNVGTVTDVEWQSGLDWVLVHVDT